MNRKFRIDTVKVDYAKVIEPLLKSPSGGWVSYMDMAIAILNDPKLSNRLLKDDTQKIISKDPKLLERFKKSEIDKRFLKGKIRNNGISITCSEYAGLFSGMERNVEIMRTFKDSFLKKRLSEMREMQSALQQYTKRSSTRQLFIKEEKIKFTDSDEKIASYNLSDETKQFIKFVKEVKKWKKESSKNDSHYELNEKKRIINDFGYSDDGFGDDETYLTNSLKDFQIYRYADSTYSLIDDLEKNYDKSKQPIEEDKNSISSVLMDNIPGTPIESIDKAIDLDNILNQVIEHVDRTKKTNAKRREEISRRSKEQSKGWVEENNRDFGGIIADTRGLKYFLKELYNQLNKIDDSNDIDACFTHRLKHPNPDYLPSHITSIIFQNDHYLRNIKHSNNDVDYSHTLKDLKLLLKKEDLTIEELKEIGYISNGIAWHLMHLGRKQKDSQRANEDIEIYVDALFKLHHHVHYIVEIHSIVESMILYRLNPETVMNDIIEPIIKLIKIMCGNNNDIKYYIGSLSKKTGLINKCKYYIEANSENSNNTILVAIVSMFLACITENYADPYNTIHAFYETVEKDDSYFDNNLDLYYLLCYYEFEQSRMLIGKFIYDEDLSRNFIGETLYIITLIYDGDEEWFQRGCSKELREDLDHYISEYSKEEKTIYTEQLLMILKKVRYAIQDYIIIDDSLDDEEDDSLDDEEDDEIEMDEEGLIFMNNIISILCKKNLSYREADLLKEIKDSCSDVEMDEDVYNEINNLIKRGDLSREELDFIIEELEKAIEKAEVNGAAITNKVVDDDMEGLICKWSFEDCKKRIENIIKEAVSIGLNQDWVQLICFCFSFNIVATIRFNIEEKRISEEETAGALIWFKKFITEKVIWNDEKEIIKDYLGSVITDRLLSSRFNKSTDLNNGDW